MSRMPWFYSGEASALSARGLYLIDSLFFHYLCNRNPPMAAISANKVSIRKVLSESETGCNVGSTGYRVGSTTGTAGSIGMNLTYGSYFYFSVN